jgi:ABC-2 type transport system permease protein
MTWVLVRKLLRDVRWPLLAVCVLLFVFSAFWVKIAQRISTEIAPFVNVLGQASSIPDFKRTFDEVIFKGPGKVSQAVMGGSAIEFDDPNDFLAIELLHPVVLVLAALWAVGRAAAAVSGEVDKGTMELLLSQPVPRDRLILAHLVVDLVVIPVICLSVVAGTQVGLWLVGDFKVDYSVLDKLPAPARMLVKPGPAVLEVSAARQPWAVLNLAALMFALSGLTMAVSSAGRSRGRTTGLAALAVVGMFIANVVGQLWDEAAFVRPFTLFYYYQPQEIWTGRWTVDLGEAWNGGQPLVGVPVLAVLVGAGAVGYLAALRVFTRRDLPAPL